MTQFTARLELSRQMIEGVQWEHGSGSQAVPGGAFPQPCTQMAVITSILERWEPRPREGKDLPKVTQLLDSRAGF